jgi:hypothetical protein
MIDLGIFDHSDIESCGVPEYVEQRTLIDMNKHHCFEP